ncbi:hypothetical protein SDC9_146070 [bioreactor metagenome]|uniref:Integrase catalytic domain-containing protein n=1 Tax=bioreactor metagenome TaxID=1076179 RepID=A0A645EAP9_9ZZZZ
MEFLRERDEAERARSRWVNPLWERAARLTRKGFCIYLRSDNESDFIVTKIRNWLREKGPITAYNEPGNAWENGSIKTSNVHMRA